MCSTTVFPPWTFQTDAALRHALQEEITEAGLLIIAQRISTILHADQILVLNEGQIAGIGRPRGTDGKPARFTGISPFSDERRKLGHVRESETRKTTGFLEEEALKIRDAQIYSSAILSFHRQTESPSAHCAALCGLLHRLNIAAPLYSARVVDLIWNRCRKCEQGPVLSHHLEYAEGRSFCSFFSTDRRTFLCPAELPDGKLCGALKSASFEAK